MIYTQLFFENEKYFQFVEKCTHAGISVPIVPGILPVTGYKQLAKMTSLCRVSIPEKFLSALEKHKDDSDYVKKCGIDFAMNQCSGLIESGVPGLHFYTLNKSFAVSEIIESVCSSQAI